MSIIGGQSSTGPKQMKKKHLDLNIFFQNQTENGWKFQGLFEKSRFFHTFWPSVELGRRFF